MQISIPLLPHFNDVAENNVTIAHKYRQHMGSDTDFSQYAASNIAYSPDDSLFASADDWGNIVIRDYPNLTTINVYSIDSASGGRPILLNWLPHDEAGLIIEVENDDHQLNSYYVDAGNDSSPQKLPDLEQGERVWSHANRMAVMQSKKIHVYEYGRG